jgi:hypothetical protein
VLNRTCGAILTVVLAALFIPAAASASDQLIVVKHRKITSFGGFAPEGPSPDTSAAAAIFGPGTVLKDSDETCFVSYDAEGVTITFADFGNPGVSACDPSAGRAQLMAATGHAWRTNRGLAVGDSLKRLKKLYREKKLRQGLWELVGKRSPIGPSGHQAVLEGAVNQGHVSGFAAFPRSAGE